MEIKFHKQENIGIVKIIGRLDASNAKQLKTSFLEFLNETRYIIFDFSELNFLDSTGLGAIVACLKSATEINGDIYIANLQTKARIVFEITRAHKLFDIYDDLDTAIEILKSSS